MDEPTPVLAVIVSAGLSAIPTVGGPIQTVFDAVIERRQHRAYAFTQDISDCVGGPEKLLARIGADPRLEPLLVQAVEAATRTVFEAKQKGLARAVVQACEDTAAVEPAQLLVNALTALEPVHIRALARMDRAARLYQRADENRPEIVEASRRESVPVKAALIQTGTVIPRNLIQDGAVEIYDVSPFGRQLLKHLRAVAEEDLERLLDGSAPP